MEIFISYRHEDSLFSIGRIRDYLLGHLPGVDFLRDIDSIPLGSTFPDVINQQLQKCDIALIIISPQWIGLDPITGKRRIDNPGDFVRIEAETVLARGIPVIPLLIRGATMPTAEQLPPSLEPLTLRQATQLQDDPYFHTDMDRIIQGIRAIMVTELDQVSSVPIATQNADGSPLPGAPIPPAPQRASAIQRWIVGVTSIVLIAAIITTLLLINRHSSSRSSASLTWNLVTSPNPGTALSTLQGVAAITADNVWSVGYTSNSGGGAYKTLIEHWDGAKWSVMASPNPGSASNELYSITAVSPTNIWAVGYYSTDKTFQTLVEHWDGMKWSVVSSPNPGDDGNGLIGVVALDAHNIWAVGFASLDNTTSHTLIEHWDGAKWSVSLSPNTTLEINRLVAIAAIAADDVWAVGNATNGAATSNTSQSLIEHFDGTAWSIVPSPSNGSIFNRLVGITMHSANDIWAVGYSTNNNQSSQTLVVHYDGFSWLIVPSPSPESGINRLTGIVAFTATDAWGVGYSSTNNIITRNIIEHWNGTSWSDVSNDSPKGDSASLFGVAAVDATNIWAVGAYHNPIQTLIIHGP